MFNPCGDLIDDMEWRVFCSASPSERIPSELWSLLGISAPSREPDRTDIYLTCTLGAGLKLRNQRDLEIKLRQGISSDGAEKWKKVLSTSLPWQVNSHNPVEVGDAFKRELLRLQPKLDEPGLKESLEEALATLSEPQQLVSVTKSRYKNHTFKLAVDSVEETSISVCRGSEAPTVWQTVCLEASKADNVSKTLSKKVVPEGSTEMSLRDYLLQCGSLEAYPQFVLDRT